MEADEVPAARRNRSPCEGESLAVDAEGELEGVGIGNDGKPGSLPDGAGLRVEAAPHQGFELVEQTHGIFPFGTKHKDRSRPGLQADHVDGGPPIGSRLSVADLQAGLIFLGNGQNGRDRPHVQAVAYELHRTHMFHHRFPFRSGVMR